MHHPLARARRPRARVNYARINYTRDDAGRRTRGRAPWHDGGGSSRATLGTAHNTQDQQADTRADDRGQAREATSMATTVADDPRAREYEELIDDEATVRSKVIELAQLVRQHAGRVVVVTGAGISTGAGVPDFRSGINSVTGLPAGKWCRQATADKWTEAQAVRERTRTAQAVPTTKAVPTRSHMALVALQKAGVLRGVISQNTDGLHRRSGFPSECLAELHGNSTIEYCGWCGREYLRDYAASLGRHLSGATLKRDLWPEHSKLSLINPRRGNHYTGRRCEVDGCGGWLFDSTVDFGDNLPEDHFERGTELARASTLCIVLGSRCSVSPASDLPQSIGESNREIDGNRKTLVVVNLQRTEVDYCTNLRIGAKIDDVMVSLMTELGKPDSPRPGAWSPLGIAATGLAEIPAFVLRRRIRIRHTTLPALQRQALQALDVERHNAKEMSVAIGKVLGVKGVAKITPRVIVKTAWAKIKPQLRALPALAAAQPIADALATACAAAPIPNPGSGKVKSELLELRDVLLALIDIGISPGTVAEHSGIGGSKIEVNAVDSNELAADVLWNVQAVLTPSTAVVTLASDDGLFSRRDVHVELTHDILRKAGGQGARGLDKYAAADGPVIDGPARGDVARVLSYPWQDHGSAAVASGGKACGYGRVRLEMLSGACAAGTTVGRYGSQHAGNMSRRTTPLNLTVGADMCAVLQGSFNAGKPQGSQLTHVIQLNQDLSALSTVVATADDSTSKRVATGEGGDGPFLGLGLMLCFRAHYGEPPCVLPLPGAATTVETARQRLEAKTDSRVEVEESVATMPGEYSCEYLMEWCPGMSTEWTVTKL